MTRVNVLTPGFTTSNGSAFLFPFIAYKNALKDAAISVHFVRRTSAGLTDCDVLAIDSKEFRLDWADKGTSILELIESYSEAGPEVIWFDTTDSSGTLQAAVIGVVSKYLKSQLLVDKTRYTERIYGGRVHSDYYNRTAGIVDDIGDPIDEPMAPQEISKLGVSWNSGLADYSTYGPWKVGLYKRVPISALLRYPQAVGFPGAERSISLSARFGATYSRAPVRYQRERIRELLSGKIDTQKLSRRGYMGELKNSKIVVSPFGWGEITLKDFEVFLTGGMLLKPSMEHMTTWPNFYEKDLTYLSHDWDLGDLESQIEWALENESERREIAQAGQSRYIEYTAGRGAADHFATHFSGIISE